MTPAAVTIDRVIADGLRFPESPRWHAGQWWFVDVFEHRVLRTDSDAGVLTVVELDEPLGGLGFLPDGTPIVAATRSRRVLAVRDEGVVCHADLSELAAHRINDLVTLPDGTTYVGAPGASAEVGGDLVLVVAADGAARVAADDAAGRPNGIVVTPDRSEVLYAATAHRCIYAHRIESDGRLGPRRLYAGLDGIAPDGICLDADGGVWVAGLDARRVVRLSPTRVIDQVVETDGEWALAPMLGGTTGSELAIATTSTSWDDVLHHEARSARGRLRGTHVGRRPAGWP